MINVRDLRLEEDIFPLFDYTHNDFAKQQLLQLFLSPLTSLHEILERQQILQAFSVNHGIMQGYGYAKADLQEVHRFILDVRFTPDPSRSLLRLRLYPRQRQELRARIIQTILLFHRWQTVYIARLDTSGFPRSYQKEIKVADHYLAGFDLHKYAQKITENKLRTVDLVRISEHIRQLTATGESARFFTFMFQFEVFWSIGMACFKRQLAFPVFQQEGLVLVDFYHPKVAHAVRNSFSSSTNVLLLTGANMSGKSTLLKSISICVYLAHLGLGVPASICRLPFFDTISVTLHHIDDLQKGYSHFLADVITLKQVVAEALANRRCFAVLDELFNGTTMEDAVEIMKTTLNGIVRLKNSFFCVAMHLHQLKNLPVVENRDVDCYYLDCTVDDHLPRFSYRLLPGWSDLRIGRLIFANEGLDELLNPQ